MSDAQAQGHLSRIAALFRRHGEAFTLTRAGESHALQGLFAPMDGQAAGTYFDADESVGLLRPALSLYLDGGQTTLPQANDVYTRDGRLWTVRKTQVFRLGDTPLLILALCD